MAKIDKKKERLNERIKFLEDQLVDHLTRKTSNVREINVAEQQRKINELRTELMKLK
jgi:archaellum component FlaC